MRKSSRRQSSKSSMQTTPIVPQTSGSFRLAPFFLDSTVRTGHHHALGSAHGGRHQERIPADGLELLRSGA